MNNTPNPTFNDYADSYAEANPESGSMELSTSLFKEGKNIIAVEVHNNANNSTDIYWDAELSHATQASGDYVSTEETYELKGSTRITLVATYEPLTDSELENSDAHPVKINEVSAFFFYEFVGNKKVIYGQCTNILLYYTFPLS